MNRYLIIAIALVLGVAASRFVRGEEVGSVVVATPMGDVKVGVNAGTTTAPTTAPTTEQAVASAGEKAARAVQEASAAAQERAAKAARRASLSFWEARGEDARATWNGAKWGVCQVGRGVTNADGYVAAAVAFPAGYVAGSAFSAAATCAQAADSIR